MINNLSIVVYAFPMHMLTLLSVDEIWLLRYVNWSTNFRGLALKKSGNGFILFKIHKICFIHVYTESNASCCLLQAIFQGFSLGRCICKKSPHNNRCMALISYFINHLNKQDILGTTENYLISNVFLWTSTYGHAGVGCLVRTYIHHLCVDTGCSLEDMHGVLDIRDRWQERVWEFYALSMT